MSDSERPSVLLIEYNEQLRSAYSGHLTREGFQVKAVDSGVLALDYLRRRGAAVMVINIGLPGMSGGDLIRDAIEIDPALAVIAMSVVNDAAIATHCMRHGAMDFLIKPVEPRQLEEAISRAVKRRVSLGGERSAVSRIREELERQTARLDGEVRRRDETIVVILEALVSALENKNPYLGGHSRRVATLAATVAERLGLSDDEIGQVKVAGQLHDLGMIGIKEDVTNKAGPLDDDEYEHVRRHVVIGTKLLSPLTHLAPVVDCVRSHHERWDGTGYPDGTAGQAIPLGGRILAAAEVYDALCSERPYRRRLATTDAVEHVLSLGGLNLDPDVSSALSTVIREQRSAMPDLDVGERGLGVV